MTEQRRLAAILVADVVGYGSGQLRRWQAFATRTAEWAKPAGASG